MLNRSFLSDMWHFWSAKLNTHQGRSLRTLAVYILAVPRETAKIDCCRLMTIGFIAQCPPCFLKPTAHYVCWILKSPVSFYMTKKLGMMEEDPTYPEDTKREYKWFICFCLIREALSWVTKREVIEDRYNGFEGQEEESLPNQWSDKKSLSSPQENNLKKYLSYNPWMRPKKLLFIHGMASKDYDGGHNCMTDAFLIFVILQKRWALISQSWPLCWHFGHPGTDNVKFLLWAY